MPRKRTTLRVCKDCGLEEGSNGEGFHPTQKVLRCATCLNLRTAACKARSNAALSTEARWERSLRERYGMTADSYWEMYEEQGGLCAICRTAMLDRKLYVDHDHESGEIRGLLCVCCNAGLGNFRDDSQLLQRAIEYIVSGRVPVSA